MDLLVVDLCLPQYITFIDLVVGKTSHLTSVRGNLHEHGALDFANFDVELQAFFCLVTKILNPNHEHLLRLVVLRWFGKPNTIDIGVLVLLCLELIRKESLVRLRLLSSEFALRLLKIGNEDLSNLA